MADFHIGRLSWLLLNMASNFPSLALLPTSKTIHVTFLSGRMIQMFLFRRVSAFFGCDWATGQVWLGHVPLYRCTEWYHISALDKTCEVYLKLGSIGTTLPRASNHTTVYQHDHLSERIQRRCTGCWSRASRPDVRVCIGKSWYQSACSGEEVWLISYTWRFWLAIKSTANHNWSCGWNTAKVDGDPPGMSKLILAVINLLNWHLRAMVSRIGSFRRQIKYTR